MISPCLEVLCGKVAVFQGRCEEHRREPFYGSTRKERLPKDWGARRQYILQRDQNTCQICGGLGTEVDHIERGDDHSFHNLRTLCTSCHASKTGREGAQARWSAPF